MASYLYIPVEPIHSDVEHVFSPGSYELHHDKKNLSSWGFRPGPTQTGHYSCKRWLEARKFGLSIKVEGLYFPIYVAKTKALISCMVTTQLICAFVFAYAKSRFSHNAAHIIFCCHIIAKPTVKLCYMHT